MDFKFIQKILPRLYSLLPFYFASRSSLRPIQAFFEMTYRCNLRCDMCHYLEIIDDTETNKTYKNELSTDDVKKAITKLPRFSLIMFTGEDIEEYIDHWETSVDQFEHNQSSFKVHVANPAPNLSTRITANWLSFGTAPLFPVVLTTTRLLN